MEMPPADSFLHVEPQPGDGGARHPRESGARDSSLMEMRHLRCGFSDKRAFLLNRVSGLKGWKQDEGRGRRGARTRVAGWGQGGGIVQDNSS